ncbi:MAG: hypothetical protein ACLFNU_12555 [Bacteroidales bacterium]
MLNKVMKLFVPLLLIQLIALTTQGKGDSTQTSNMHQVQVHMGRLAYANTLNLPNGLPGNIFTMQYSWHETTALSSWKSELSASLSTSALHFSISPSQDAPIYRFNDLAIELGWHWKAPSILPNTEINLGIGPSLVAELTYPPVESYENTTFLFPWGLWGINGSGHIQILYSAEKFVLGGKFGLAIVGVGHIPKPPYINFNLSQNLYTYYLRPNAIYHLLNYNLLNGEFSFALPHKNVYYNISYFFKYFCHSLAPFYQTYAQHSVGLGITF